MRALTVAIAAWLLPLPAIAQEASSTPAPPPSAEPTPVAAPTAIAPTILAPAPSAPPVVIIPLAPQSDPAGARFRSADPNADDASDEDEYGLDHAGRREWWERRPVRRRARTRQWYFLMEAGPTYQRLYSLSLWGAGATLEADRETEWGAVRIGASFADGSLAGLNLVHFAVRTEIEGRAGGFRLGGGFGIGFLGIATVTAVDPPTSAFAADGSLHMTYDVAPFDPPGRRAFYLGAKLVGSVAVASDTQPIIWGPLIVAGFRL